MFDFGKDFVHKGLTFLLMVCWSKVTSLGNEIYAFVNDQAISIPFSLQKCLSKLEIL